MTKNINLHWMSLSFLAMTSLFPQLKPKLWKWLYNKIATLDTSGNFLFMNYGYSDQNLNHQLILDPKDEAFRYSIQLYHHITKNIMLEDKDILEMGCGRGGGGSFFLRYKKPRSYVGIDLSQTAIEWCQRQHHFSHARWLQGSADCIPMPDASIDVVTNVESSHCYPSMINFIKEVKRILRPNGYFAMCDLRPKNSVQALDETLKASGLKILNRKDITPEVIEALNSFSQNRKSQIANVFPKFFQRTIDDFAATKDTRTYQMLMSGELSYMSYSLQK